MRNRRWLGMAAIGVLLACGDDDPSDNGDGGETFETAFAVSQRIVLQS